MRSMRATLEAYTRWAPIYPPFAHNPLMRVEQRSMSEMWPDVRGKQVLDLACGSGRYTRLLAETGAAEVISVDFCMPMLRQMPTSGRICASMMQLPFRDETFDAVVCGLALGHASDLGAWMREVARVLRAGGSLLYSDFHPQAAEAGLTRSFKDENDFTCTVPHARYGIEVQLAAALMAGFSIAEVREVRVGHELREPFAGSDSFYRNWHGLPIVLVVRGYKA